MISPNERNLISLARFRKGQSRYKIVKNLIPFSHKEVRAVIVHSPVHTRWAETLKRDIQHYFSTLYEGLFFSIELLAVPNSYTQAQQILRHHPEFGGRTLRSCKPRKHFAFAITTGYWESSLVSDMRSYLGMEIPQIYCVQGPAEFASEFFKVCDDASAIGVESTPTNALEYVAGIRALVPHIENLCIVTEANPESQQLDFYLTRREVALRKAFEHKNIAVTTAHWQPEDSSLKTLFNRASRSQAIVMLDSPAATAHHPSLINFCNEQKILLCASELDSVVAGAGLGCGVSEESFSRPLMSLVNELLIKHDEYAEHAIYEIPEQSGMRYNLDALVKQGVRFDDEQGALLRMKSVFDPSAVEL